ncbi:putative translation initiation factor if-3 protein [Zalerion maritima]|uniref:Translation initiation factor if-3 protein n=1 Tax=Zalerion maritima TaxID=339359 RepID=A0AAD5WNW4_9PEZI|nr:putative translation initiation factor if-3 protein [Zalerion maritima]
MTSLHTLGSAAGRRTAAATALSSSASSSSSSSSGRIFCQRSSSSATIAILPTATRPSHPFQTIPPSPHQSLRRLLTTTRPTLYAGRYIKPDPVQDKAARGRLPRDEEIKYPKIYIRTSPEAPTPPSVPGLPSAASSSSSSSSSSPPPPSSSPEEAEVENAITSPPEPTSSSPSSSLSIPLSTQDVLASLDRKTHYLQVVTFPQPNWELQPYPICVVVDKAASRLAEKSKKKEKREKRVTTKKLELNWAIDTGDLAHKVKRMRQFLEAGFRVDVLLAPKRRGVKKAEGKDAKELIAKLEELVEGVKAFEHKKREGQMLGVMRMYFQGRKRDGVEGEDVVVEEKGLRG